MAQSLAKFAAQPSVLLRLTLSDKSRDSVSPMAGTAEPRSVTLLGCILSPGISILEAIEQNVRDHWWDPKHLYELANVTRDVDR